MRSDKKLRENLQETRKTLKLDATEWRAEKILSPQQKEIKKDIGRVTKSPLGTFKDGMERTSSVRRSKSKNSRNKMLAAYANGLKRLTTTDGQLHNFSHYETGMLTVRGTWNKQDLMENSHNSALRRSARSKSQSRRTTSSIHHSRKKKDTLMASLLKNSRSMKKKI